MLMPAILGLVSKRSEWARASLSRYLEGLALLAGLAVLGYFGFVTLDNHRTCADYRALFSLGGFALRNNWCQ